MRKGEFAWSKMFSLILGIIILAVVAYAAYTWITNGYVAFGDTLQVPGAG